MNSNSPNIESLRQLYKESPVAKAFFDHVAHRERDRSEIKVDRILVLLKAEGNTFQRREIINLFRELQGRGCGQFVEGRRGWPSRFVWSAGMTSIGRAAAGEQHSVDHISAEENGVDYEELDDPQINNSAISAGADSGAIWYEDNGADGTAADEATVV